MTFSYQHISHVNAPVVALHSSASSSGQWRQLAEDLEGRFDLHAFDLPGYGKSPLVPDMSLNGIAQSAAPVINVIEETGEPVHLIGHSNGAGIAIKVALMRPDLVKSLTLYEPASFHFLKDGSETEKSFFDEIQDVSQDLTSVSGMQHFLDFWNGNGFWEGLPHAARERFAGMTPAVLQDFAQAFAENWTLADLSYLTMSTLVMTGLESPAIAQHVSIAIGKAIPDARIALLPELGHMAPIFQPEWVNSRIFEHVASAERPVTQCKWPSQAAA